MNAMKTTSETVALMMCASLLLVVAACADDPCAPADTVVPGVGVGVGDDAVCLGQTRAEVEAVLGAGQTAYDLGAVGLRVAHPSHNLSVSYSAAGTLNAVYLDTGAAAKTAGGVGLGSTAAAARAALGTPAEDPFMNDLWYPAAGLVVQLAEGKVAAMQIMAPAASK